MSGTCAVWSPLPPQRSGIADYASGLLEALSQVADVVAVSDEAGLVSAPAGVPVVSPGDPSLKRATSVYQMGNHAAAHGWIYRRALTDSGILVLHDTSLLGFHHEYFGGMAAPEFEREVEYAHGPIRGHQHDAALLGGWPALAVDGVKVLDSRVLTLERRLVERSRAVVVHDPFSAGWLRARYPGTPVHVVPHGAAIRDDNQREIWRDRLGWNDDNLVFGVYGGFSQAKRILVVVLAFAQVRRRFPDARLILAGHPDDPRMLSEIHAVIADHGIADSVHIAQGPAEHEFDGLISAADLVVNLRWPSVGETSGVMMRAFGAGRAVITSDLPQYRHLDGAFCWRVPVDPEAEADALGRAMERALLDPEAVRRAGKQAREYVAEHASWPVAAEGYRRIVDETAVTASPAGRVTAADRPGVNIFADPRATTGLSESARRHAIALVEAGADITFTEFNSHAPNRSVSVPDQLATARGGKDHPIDLWLVNLNEFQLIPEHATDRYTIALWAWELPDVLEYSIKELPRIDELWVVSSFVGETFRTVTDKPITVIPNVVTQFGEIAADRPRFGLPEDCVVVLFSWSASSSDARKNPWGVIDAFRQAFSPAERGTHAHLVIKAIDLGEFPELTAHLAAAVADVNGTLISEDLTRAEMDSLLACCDIYVSLHRSEGFGMGMAEAMALGKPVIATGYGGNTDFMPPGSAAMVGYQIRPITEADHRFGAKFGGWYRPGHLWAEPDVAQAAKWLRMLAGSERTRRVMGSRARAAVQETCSSAAVGATMERRLREIYRSARWASGIDLGDDEQVRPEPTAGERSG